MDSVGNSNFKQLGGKRYGACLPACLLLPATAGRPASLISGNTGGGGEGAVVGLGKGSNMRESRKPPSGSSTGQAGSNSPPSSRTPPHLHS